MSILSILLSLEPACHRYDSSWWFNGIALT
jgi:hypothetical protein